MRTEYHFIIRAVAFCGFAAVVAVFAEKEVAAARAREEANAPKAEAVVAEKILEVSPEIAKKGEGLYASYGCIGCHSADGSMRVGPSFLGLYGKTEKLSDGSTVKVDEAYLRESILNPSQRIVSGYTPTMPSFASRMEREEQDALIVWVKSLK